MKHSKLCRSTGKVRFATELDAKIVLAHRVWNDKGEKRVYKCEFGDHYHLSSQDKRNAA